MTSIFTRDKEKTRRREGHWEWGRDGSDGDTKIAHNHWKPEEARKPSPFEPPQGSAALPDTLILVFWLQKCEKLHFCCFKPPSLFNLEKAMAAHFSTLAWRLPWMEEPGRLQSMGSHRVGHDWRDLAAAKQQDCFWGNFSCLLSLSKWLLEGMSQNFQRVF